MRRRTAAAAAAAAPAVRVRLAETRGWRWRRMAQLRVSCPSTYTRLSSDVLDGIPALLDSLARGLAARNWVQMNTTLNLLLPLVSEQPNAVTQRDLSNRQTLVAADGIDVMLAVLPHAEDVVRDFDMRLARNNVIATCIYVLRELAATIPDMADLLCERPRLQIILQLLNGYTFDGCAALLEDMLIACRQQPPLVEYPEFTGRLRTMSPRELAAFCRVLTALVTDGLESRSSMQGMLADRWREQQLVDSTQLFLLRDPELLSRIMRLIFIAQLPETGDLIVHANRAGMPQLVGSEAGDPDDNWGTAYRLQRDIEARLKYRVLQGRAMERIDCDTPTQSSRAASTMSSWRARMRMMAALFRVGDFVGGGGTGDDTAEQRALMETDVRDLLSSMPSDGLFGRLPIPQLTVPVTLRTFRISIHLSEILFVVTSLLSSTRRHDFRRELVRLGLPQLLLYLFCEASWDQPPDAVDELERPHGPNCECNMFTTTRVQLLRLLQVFCDHDVCSPTSRVVELLEGRGTSAPPDHGMTVFEIERLRTIGLIPRLVERYVSTTAESPYRYWLGAVLEAYLRSTNSREQDTLAASPLLMHLARSCLDAGDSEFGEHQTTVLQATFDVLAELVKYNAKVLRLFERAIVAMGAWPALSRIITDNMVDSNVFVRSVFLTLYVHRVNGLTPVAADVETFDKLLRPRQGHLVASLIRSVGIDSIAQSNMCCVNTALVVMLSALRRGRSVLAHLLVDVMSHEAVPGELAEAFVPILHFWREYYFVRGRDKAVLEYSTGVPFVEWHYVVKLLIADEAVATAAAAAAAAAAGASAPVDEEAARQAAGGALVAVGAAASHAVGHGYGRPLRGVEARCEAASGQVDQLGSTLAQMAVVREQHSDAAGVLDMYDVTRETAPLSFDNGGAGSSTELDERCSMVMFHRAQYVRDRIRDAVRRAHHLIREA